ncbi:DUF4214 domain-containing protein [Sphingobium limneticum]|uniref:DUF1796 family putative cysteine peptidase n=1 Tax=Sphingobium limneticum TaxID=1007511 RepID=UPI00123D0ABC|nr:DUF1796 family putative cysteine peptidase [Sphingobium limneticum]KAA9010774.1 DUF4214 domain-containing protein [Sphingobium limneticum]
MDHAEAQALVRTIYRGVLKREADPSGEDHYINILKQGGYSVVKDVIESFISSKEFERLISKNWVETDIFFPEQPAEHIISLGVDCFSASKIKQIGRRTGSFPLDWCFSTPEMLNHILEDDFNIFLDRKYFLTNEDIKRPDIHINQCDHLYYRDKFDISFVFNHKNPTNETDYNYYRRTVDRFRNNLSSDKQKLFVLISWRGNYQLSSFMKMLDILNSRSDSHSVIAINVKNISDNLYGSYIRYRSGTDCLLDFYCNSTSSNGLNLDDPRDDIFLNNLLISRTNGMIKAFVSHG